MSSICVINNKQSDYNEMAGRIHMPFWFHPCSSLNIRTEMKYSRNVQLKQKSQSKANMKWEEIETKYFFQMTKCSKLMHL